MKPLFIAMAVLGLSSAAFAQESKVAFEAVDTDANGIITAEELMAAFPEITREDFAGADENSDEGLNEDEFVKFVTSATGNN